MPSDYDMEASATRIARGKTGSEGEWMRESVSVELRAAYEAGATDMREKAAGAVTRYHECSYCPGDPVLQDSIRNLPLPAVDQLTDRPLFWCSDCGGTENVGNDHDLCTECRLKLRQYTPEANDG